MLLLTASLALALDPPLKTVTSGKNCLKIPCDGIQADPTAGIMPSDVLEALGLSARTDLTWTPVSVLIGDSAIDGWLVAPDDGAGDLDVSTELYFYAEHALDADGSVDVLAGPVEYVAGESFSARLDVTFDGAAWSPTHQLVLEANYVTRGAAAAGVGSWQLDQLHLEDLSTGGVTGADPAAPTSVAVSSYGFEYASVLTLSGSTSLYVEEALALVTSTQSWMGSLEGWVGARTSSLTSTATYTDGVDVDSESASVTATPRDTSYSAVATLVNASGAGSTHTTGYALGSRRMDTQSTSASAGAISFSSGRLTFPGGAYSAVVAPEESALASLQRRMGDIGAR